MSVRMAQKPSSAAASTKSGATISRPTCSIQDTDLNQPAFLVRAALPRMVRVSSDRSLTNSFSTVTSVLPPFVAEFDVIVDQCFTMQLDRQIEHLADGGIREAEKQFVFQRPIPPP
jgi:hypothetical protein